MPMGLRLGPYRLPTEQLELLDLVIKQVLMTPRPLSNTRLEPLHSRLNYHLPERL